MKVVPKIDGNQECRTSICANIPIAEAQFCQLGFALTGCGCDVNVTELRAALRVNPVGGAGR